MFQGSPHYLKQFTYFFKLPTHLFDTFGGHKVNNLSRHMEVLGGYVAQGDAVLGQELGQGVDCATVLQVPHHGYLRDGWSE